MSSVFTLDDDPIVIVVPSAADIPPGDITEAEWLQLKDRVTIVEANGIADLSDVDLSGIENGQVLVWDVSTETWRAGMVQSGIYRVFDWDVELDGPFNLIQTVRPLFAQVHPGYADRARIGINVGTAADTVAAGNHTHTQPLPTRVAAGPSGYISGGSQSLGSTTITLPSGVACIVEAEVYGQFRGADSGAAYYTISLNIAGNIYTSPGGTDGFWCVQGVPDKFYWTHERKITGDGTGIPVIANVAWHSGSGFNIDRTYLKVRVRPDR